MTIVRVLSATEGGEEVSIIKLLQALGGGERTSAAEALDEPQNEVFLTSDGYGHQAAEFDEERYGGEQRAPAVRWADNLALEEAGRRQAWAPQQQEPYAVQVENEITAMPFRSSASRVAGPIMGARQPGSLWQTTNKAIGGIYH